MEVESTSGPAGEIIKRDVVIPQAMTCEPKELQYDLLNDQSGQTVEPPPAPGVGQLCLHCHRHVIEMDGYCATYGPISGQWWCNECVFWAQAGNTGGAPPIKPPMNRGQLEAAHENLVLAIRNLCVIQGFKARDPSGACRDIPDLSLTWRETRDVLESLLRVVRKKLMSDGL